jgi:hypothetical protein
MGRLLRGLASGIAGASLLALAACLLVLAVLTLRTPELLTRIESLTKFLAGFVPGTALLVWIQGRVRARMAAGGDNLSNALAGWLASEWLILLLVWVFVGVEIITLSYVAPVYAVRVELVGSGPDLRTAALGVSTTPSGVPLTEGPMTESTAVFRSPRILRWGAGDSVMITARGYGARGFAIPWSGFAPLRLTSAIPVGPVRLQPAQVRLTVRVVPHDARVTVAPSVGPPVSGTGAQVVDVAVGLPVSLTATASGRAEARLTVIPGADTTVTLTLSRSRGRLTLTAVNAGGEPQPGLQVFLDGENWGARLGVALEVAAGPHRVYLEARVTDRLVYTDTVRVEVPAGGRVTRQLITKVRSLPQ